MGDFCIGSELVEYFFSDAVGRDMASGMRLCERGDLRLGRTECRMELVNREAYKGSGCKNLAARMIFEKHGWD